MLSDSPSIDLTALLSIAQETHIIDGWTVAGPVVMLRRSDANFYVKLDGLERLLQTLRADC